VGAPVAPTILSSVPRSVGCESGKLHDDKIVGATKFLYLIRVYLRPNIAFQHAPNQDPISTTC
jgi:hypothetical protein